MSQTPPELFAERPVRSDFAKHGLSYRTRRLITLGVLFAVAGGGTYLGVAHFRNATPAQIPTIKAEGSYKQKPQQPGGIDIPHQDVEVYHELDGNPGKAEVEHLMPPPEVPMVQAAPTAPKAPAEPLVKLLPDQSESLLPPEAPSQHFDTTVTSTTRQSEATSSGGGSAYPSKTASSPGAVSTGMPSITPPSSSTGTATPAPSANAVTAAPADLDAPPPIAVPTPSVTTGSSSAPTPTLSPTQAQVMTAAPAPTATPSLATQALATPAAKQPHLVAPSKGEVMVQLASVPDQATADRVREKLQSRFASQLGETRLHLTRADLGSKGIYYRIQSSPLSEHEATRLCSELKSMNAGCILVR